MFGGQLGIVQKRSTYASIVRLIIFVPETCMFGDQLCMI